MSASSLPAEPSLALSRKPERSLFDEPLARWALVLGAVATFLYWQQPLGNVLFGLQLPDTDDAMRLVQVRDLLAGQGWFDATQHRFLPPAGAPMHWSRFVDLPIAGLILASTPLVGARLAEGLVLAFWPPLLFLAYLGLLFWGVRRLFGARAACFALFVAAETLVLAGLFAFGRIDHHNVQVLAILGLALCVMTAPGSGRAALAAGALGGFSLAVGLETLPYVGLAGLAYAILWIRSGGPGGTPFSAFGAALGASAILAFAAQTAPADWVVTRCDALSPPWLALAAGAGAIAAGLAAVGAVLATPVRRAAAAVLGCGLIGGLLLIFPACAAGPFAGMPARVRAEWLTNVNEAMPFWRHLAMSPDAALAMLGPHLLAALVASALAWRSAAGLRLPLTMLAAILWLGTAMSLVHMRGLYISSAFIPLVAGLVFDRALARRAGPPGPLLVSLGIALLFLGKVWAMAVVVSRPLLGAGPPPAASTAWEACARPESPAGLDELPPGLILGPIDLGPYLLVRSRHSVVAAPYHRNHDGLLAGLELISGSEAQVREAVRRHGADYLLLCKPWIRPEVDGRRPFAADLAGGARPDWLDPVAPGSGPLLLWRVRQP